MMSTWFKHIVDGLSGPLQKKFGHIFGIVDAALGAGNASGYWDGHPSYRWQFTDNSLAGASTFVGCTAAFTTGFGVRGVRAYVWLKNYVLNAATAAQKGFIVQLQVATSVSAFDTFQTSTGLSVIDMKELPRARCAVLLSGITPDNTNYAAARIAVFPHSAVAGALGDSASFDCNIDAVP